MSILRCPIKVRGPRLLPAWWPFVVLTFVAASSAVEASNCYSRVSKDKYPSCSQLSANVSLHWAIGNGSITWALDVDGEWDWVGLGISEGGMLGADIAVAALDKSTSEWDASDYWSTGFQLPQLDQQQDVALMSASRASKAGVYGSTLVELRRPLVTCDPANQDRPILNDTRQSVIFAYGTGPFGYHGTHNRGQSQVKFIPDPSAAGSGAPATPPLKSLEIRMPAGYVVPPATTAYQCVNLALPNDTKYHIYRYEPLVDNTPLVHHFVAYSCPGSSPPAIPVGVAYDCLRTMECEEFYMGWAPGLRGVDAPPLAALPFGVGTSVQYLALQIHYTRNEVLTNQTDRSGFRILYSPVLKQYDMGVLTLGSYEIAVPPGAPSWSTAPNVCPGLCTARLAAGVNASGLTLVESFYHMHMLGRSMVTRHVRGGVELPPLGSREYFGFEYQASVDIPPGARQLLPGDSLITTCTYTGEGRTNVTRLGKASWDEMCFNFLSYYPYNPAITECVSVSRIHAATCTPNNILETLTNPTAAFEAGHLVHLPADGANFTPYNPTCDRTAPLGAGSIVTEVPTPSKDGGSSNSGDGSTGNSPGGGGNDGLSGGAIAGIVVGSVVGAVLLAAAVGAVVYKVMRKKPPTRETDQGEFQANPIISV